MPPMISPAFFTPTSGIAAPHRVDSAHEKWRRPCTHKWSLGLEGGFLIANPIPVEFSADPRLVQHAIDLGLKEAASTGVYGQGPDPIFIALRQCSHRGKKPRRQPRFGRTQRGCWHRCSCGLRVQVIPARSGEVCARLLTQKPVARRLNSLLGLSCTIFAS